MNDPIEFILNDHRKAEALFKQYEEIDELGYETKNKTVRKLIRLLRLHMEMEERLVYPLASRAFEEEARKMVEEAKAEHGIARRLLEELSVTHPEDPQFDARVKVLNETFTHHVLEEEEELLPSMEEKVAGEDMATLSEELERFHAEHEDVH